VCESGLRGWLGKNEPGVEWDGDFKLMKFLVFHVKAAEGTFLREGKTIDYVFVPAEYNDPARLFVSSLPKERESSVLELLCSNFPLAYQNPGLYAGREILIDAVICKKGYEESVKFDLYAPSENDPELPFRRRLLPGWLDADSLYEKVSYVHNDDQNPSMETKELAREFGRHERNRYWKSARCENLGVEITLSDGKPPAGRGQDG